VRDGHKAFDITAAVALPEFAPPMSLKAFNSFLEARLARRREHPDDPQGQTQAADTPDRVGELMCPLKGLKAPGWNIITRLWARCTMCSCTPSK
jgi:hypothetical protein